MSSTDTTERLRITLPAGVADRVSLALEPLAESYASWQPADSDQMVFDAYFEGAEDAARAASTLTHQLMAWAADDAWHLVQESLPAEDWANAWKTFFHVERVSPRLVIRPSWEPYTPQPGDCVIEMDPGMSFGTGQHETTRGCLRFLDRLTGESTLPGSFLDLGCGSGILSIAAARLGCRPVLACDIDPDAVTIATGNMASNGCAANITAVVGDVAALEIPAPFDIVAANILAPVLLEHASSIVRYVAPGGQLLLAGILATQYAAVRDAYLPFGFSEIASLADGEWTSGHLRKHA